MKIPQNSPVEVAMRPAESHAHHMMLAPLTSLEVPAQGHELGRAHLFSRRDAADDLD